MTRRAARRTPFGKFLCGEARLAARDGFCGRTERTLAVLRSAVAMPTVSRATPGHRPAPRPFVATSRPVGGEGSMGEAVGVGRRGIKRASKRKTKAENQAAVGSTESQISATI